jgi:hypothetical protein
VLFVGLGLRVWESFESSLWLDELHSLAHASPDTIAGVCEHVHWDLHVPLFFVALHFFRWVTCPESLRLVPVLSNLLVVVPLLAFARRSRLGAGAPLASAALFATLPYQILYATELRPYAWLTLASAAACWAAFSDSASRVTRFATFAVATAAGVITHHLMPFSVMLIGAARLLFALPPLRRARFTSRGPLLHLGLVILAGATGASALVPWLRDEMRWAVENPGELERPGDQALTSDHVADIVQAPLKTLVPQVRSLGEPWTAVTTAGTAMLGGAIAIGAIFWAARALRRDLPPADRSIALATTFAILSIPLLAVSIWSWGRVSIRYVTISTWLWPVVACELFAAVRSVGLRRVLIALAVLGALAAGVGHAGGTTREDVRGAVALARRLGAELAQGGAEPFYTAFLSQPPRFEHCTPYYAYARDLPCVELKDPIHAGPRPKLLPARGEPGFEQPVIVILRRWLDLDTPKIREKARREQIPEIPRLLDGREVVRRIALDGTISVWVLEPAHR